MKFLTRDLNFDLSDLSLLSSQDYRRELTRPAVTNLVFPLSTTNIHHKEDDLILLLIGIIA
jgi:hypothetical protein